MHIKVCEKAIWSGCQVHLLQLQQKPKASSGHDQARGDLEAGSAVARGGVGGGGARAAIGAGRETGLNGSGIVGAACCGSRRYCIGLGTIGGGRAVDGGVVAVQLALLLGGADTGVARAVGVAGQQVDILRAEAGVVGLGARVDLALDGGNADVESSIHP
jgi:hypothetical protein